MSFDNGLRPIAIAGRRSFRLSHDFGQLRGSSQISRLVAAKCNLYKYPLCPNELPVRDSLSGIGQWQIHWVRNHENFGSNPSHSESL